MRPALAVWATLLAAAAAPAHEVDLNLSAQPAAVLQLQYPDGSPFAYESYELYPAGTDLPAQVGRSDAAGRIAFVPDGAAQWRLKAYSEDGHGIDTEITVTPGAAAAPPANGPGERAVSLVTGAALLFGLFGLYQLFANRSRKR